MNRSPLRLATLLTTVLLAATSPAAGADASILARGAFVSSGGTCDVTMVITFVVSGSDFSLAETFAGTPTPGSPSICTGWPLSSNSFSNRHPDTTDVEPLTKPDTMDQFGNTYVITNVYPATDSSGNPWNSCQYTRLQVEPATVGFWQVFFRSHAPCSQFAYEQVSFFVDTTLTRVA